MKRCVFLFSLGRYSELKGPRGYIYSPLYPKSVLTYETFSYKITVAVQKKVVLSFKEFDLVSDEGEETECDYVYIEVTMNLTNYYNLDRENYQGIFKAPS